jgi:hypothetical protein
VYAREDRSHPAGLDGSAGIGHGPDATVNEAVSHLDVSADHITHEFVFGELLIGDKGGRTQLLADYLLMHQAPSSWESTTDDHAPHVTPLRPARIVVWRPS